MLNKVLSINDNTPTAANYSHYLDRVEVAVPIKWEADDVRGVMVPASIDRVAHDVTDFRKHVFNQGLVTTERDPLAKVRRNTHHQTLAGAWHPAQLLILAPALQLSKHGLQLEVSCLLIQQTVVLQEIGKRTWHFKTQQKEICEYLPQRFKVRIFLNLANTAYYFYCVACYGDSVYVSFILASSVINNTNFFF